MGPCCDDQHRPGGVAGPAREDGPAVTVLPCLALTTDPKDRHGRTSPLSCKASCGQPVPKSVAATPPVIPCVRTAEPWIRRRRIPPSSCHSVHTGDRARTSSRTHLRPRARPLRVHRPGALRCVLELGAPPSGRPSPPTGTLRAARCVSSRAGSFDAVGDSNPVPQRVTCPRPRGNVPQRAGCPRPLRLAGRLGSQATGAASGPVLITVARSDLMTPASTARRWGSTGGGSGVLQVGGALVQYAQPPTSRSPPSCNRPAQSRSGPDSTLNHDFRVPAREPEGV